METKRGSLSDTWTEPIAFGFGRDGYAVTIPRITAGGLIVLHNFGNISAGLTRITVKAQGDKITATIGSLAAMVTETQRQSSAEIGYQVNATTARMSLLTVRT